MAAQPCARVDRAKLAAPMLMSERDWQSLVVDAARVHGWETFHVLDSRGMTAGWPDLVMIRPPEVLFVELKRANAKARPAQLHVLDMLERCELEVHVWRPQDEPEVLARLARRKAPAQ